jgi:O-antigen ligase
VLTFTRSSIVLGVLVILLFLLAQRRFVILAGVTVMAAVILGSALTFGCSSAPGSPGPTINPGAILGDRFSDGNDRMALWYSASRVMLDHPIFGVGLDKMSDAVKANPGRYAYTPFGVATSSAHNTILLAGAETGVVGALAILGINIGIGLIALGCTWRGRKRESALLLAAGLAMGAYLVQGMFNNLFSVPATSSVFALAVGAFAASYRSAREGPETSRAPDESPHLDPYTSPASEASTPDGDH